MKTVAVFVVALVAAAGAALAQEALPSPHQGYEWVQLQPLHASFLKPVGWHFKTEGTAPDITFYLTREDLAQKALVVGLTIKVHHPKTASAAQAGQIVDRYMEMGEVKRAWPASSGEMTGYGAFVRRDRRPPSMVHAIALANPKTNILYEMIFEAPESEWDAAWEIGDLMLRTFVLDESD